MLCGLVVIREELQVHWNQNPGVVAIVTSETQSYLNRNAALGTMFPQCSWSFLFSHPLLFLPQVDKVTGRFNGQFKTYAICGAIRRMVSVQQLSGWGPTSCLHHTPEPHISTLLTLTCLCPAGRIRRLHPETGQEWQRHCQVRPQDKGVEPFRALWLLRRFHSTLMADMLFFSPQELLSNGEICKIKVKNKLVSCFNLWCPVETAGVTVSLVSRARGGAAAALSSQLVSQGCQGLQAWICLAPLSWLPQLTQAACERGGANSRLTPNQWLNIGVIDH